MKVLNNISKTNRLFYLDFIRAMSMIFIVIYHFNCTLIEYSIKGYPVSLKIIPNDNLGTIGVSLFFIISGYALMYSYQDKFQLKDYIKKRFIAIYPMFWLAYAIAFLYLFYVTCSINTWAHTWTIILTILGFDGYLVYKIPDFYILGEWFLGCIILFYICFPILRTSIIKHPKLLICCIGILYIIIVERYVFKMEIDRNFFTRLPDFIFGMYCFQYVKKINIYQFIGAIFICLFVLFTGLKIPIMYHITIVGFSLFIILAFIGQHIHQESIKNMFMPISKYSYAIFLVHHVILYQLMAKFKGMTISAIESYCLFTIACILIAIISWYLYKMHSKIRTYLDGYFNMTAYAGASTNNTR